jgi:hypothetical protein
VSVFRRYRHLHLGHGGFHFFIRSRHCNCLINQEPLGLSTCAESTPWRCPSCQSASMVIPAKFMCLAARIALHCGEHASIDRDLSGYLNGGRKSIHGGGGQGQYWARLTGSLFSVILHSISCFLQVESVGTQYSVQSLLKAKTKQALTHYLQLPSTWRAAIVYPKRLRK